MSTSIYFRLDIHQNGPEILGVKLLKGIITFFNVVMTSEEYFYKILLLTIQQALFRKNLKRKRYIFKIMVFCHP
jgi:hypothetical protein